MHLLDVALTILAALANGYAAALNVAGAESVKVVADRVHVSPRWMRPFGALLGAGAAGLLTGLAVTPIGVAAAACLVLYFVGAVGAHVRAGDAGWGGAAFFLILAGCVLVTDLADHGLL